MVTDAFLVIDLSHAQAAVQAGVVAS
jgi:hypothetical protein